MPSTVIRRFHYHPTTRALDVVFVTGRVYRYAEVPADLVERLREAFVTGRFFNARIRDRFACVELNGDEAELGEL